MIRVDNKYITGYSPDTLTFKSWTRETITKTFPGVDGELRIDLGKRSRILIQKGRMRAQRAFDMNNMILGIEVLMDGKTHTLKDNYGGVYNNVIVESFEAKSPIKTGVGVFCDYEIKYRQLA